jgi:N-methylhydantoinase B/oxoprolinase/acetone carboxylase alpha subunit
LSPSQCAVVETPGAGGYADPRQRSRALLDADARSSLFLRDCLARSYGARGAVAADEAASACRTEANRR